MKRGARPFPGQDDLHALIALRRLEREVRESVQTVLDRSEDSQPLVIHEGGGHFLLVMQRLEEIEDALERGDRIDDRLRKELQAAVALLARDARARADTPKRGRPIDEELRRRAAVVGVLHKRHGVKLEAALNVVALQDGREEDRRKDRQNIKRAYSKLTASGKTVRAAGWRVRAALARLGIDKSK